MRSNDGNRVRLLATMIVGWSLAISSPLIAENIDPVGDDSQYAYGENIGWLNAEPSGDGGPGVEVSDFELTGWFWGENIGWVSLSCQNTASCASVDYGVTNDGHGNLGGFGWSENGGWINFASDSSSVGIDPATGAFEGYAWTENMGWIGMSCSNTGSCGSVDYGVTTGWCQSVIGVPTGIPDVSAALQGSDVRLSWPAIGQAAWYEIVRGDLAVLRSSGGDFDTATQSCVSDNDAGTVAVVSGSPGPSPGDAYWYLVRGVNCKGKGTYDSGGGSQVGVRDLEVGGSGNDCS